MKAICSLLAIGGSLFAPAAVAQVSNRMPMRDAATHDQIVEAARKAKEEAPAPVFKPAEGGDPSVANRPKDLLSRSDIVCYLGNATLIPKRAVLHVPKELSSRLVMQDGARFVVWKDFFMANRAWIRAVTVSRAQAEGRVPIDEDTLESFAKEPRLVVATYQEGPISVSRLRTPPPETATAPGAAVTGQKAVVSTANPVAKP